MNEAKLQEFMGRLVTDMGGAAMMASVILGDELGLYRAMADGRPTTAEDLAGRTGCHPRLVREWLSAQAASGYVEHEGGSFRLPPEQAMALADEDSPVYVAGGATVLGSLFLDKDKIVAAMRGNGALSWADHHPCLFSGTERFFRPGYRAHLVSEWLQALDGVVPRLERGAKVADVGCGHGASTVILAQAFPASEFHGFDFHGPSIEKAQRRAEEAGVASRTRFTQAAAREFPGDDYDLVCFFDCLHDMGDPVGAARRAHRALKPGGTVLLVEPFANDELDENLTPVGRLYYAASTCICTPNCCRRRSASDSARRPASGGCAMSSRRPALPASAGRRRHRSTWCWKHASSSRCGGGLELRRHPAARHRRPLRCRRVGDHAVGGEDQRGDRGGTPVFGLPRLPGPLRGHVTRPRAEVLLLRCSACFLTVLKPGSRVPRRVTGSQRRPRLPLSTPALQLRCAPHERNTMAHEGYHEPAAELSDAARDMHRAIQSLIEELEAVDWYNQRVDVCKNPELRAILAHNRDEEKEHAAMLLEWIRRNDGSFEHELRDYVFTDKPLTHD